MAIIIRRVFDLELRPKGAHQSARAKWNATW